MAISILHNLRSSYRLSVLVGCWDHLPTAALAALSAAIGRFLVGTIVLVCALATHAESAVVADVPIGVGRLRLFTPLARDLLRVGNVGQQYALVTVTVSVPPNGINLFLWLRLIRSPSDGYSGHNRHRQECN